MISKYYLNKRKRRVKNPPNQKKTKAKDPSNMFKGV